MSGHRRTVHIARVLAAAVVASSLPLIDSTPMLSSSAAAAVVADPPISERVLVPELSTETSVTYREVDGSMTVESSPVSVNYEDEFGAWRPIDTALVEVAGERWAVENAAAAFETRLPEDAGADPVRFAADGNWVTMSLDGIGGAPEVDGSTATYDASGVADEVEYQSQAYGLKETIVLAQPPAAGAALDVDLKMSSNLTPVLSDSGAVEFTDSSGLVAFTMPAGWMADSAGAPAISNEVD